jgi:hypothetical protein
LWDFEGQLRSPTGPWNDVVKERWTDILDDVTRLIEKDPVGEWPRQATESGGAVGQKLAVPPRPEAPDEALYAFRDYRRVLIARFFQVDKELKSLCAEVIKLGAPLRALVKGMADAN